MGWLVITLYIDTYTHTHTHTTTFQYVILDYTVYYAYSNATFSLLYYAIFILQVFLLYINAI